MRDLMDVIYMKVLTRDEIGLKQFIQRRQNTTYNINNYDAKQ